MVKTYSTREAAERNIDRKSHGYDSDVFELYCQECGNTFWTVGFSAYRKAVCSCGEDTDGMVRRIIK